MEIREITFSFLCYPWYEGVDRGRGHGDKVGGIGGVEGAEPGVEGRNRGVGAGSGGRGCGESGKIGRENDFFK